MRSTDKRPAKSWLGKLVGIAVLTIFISPLATVQAQDRNSDYDDRDRGRYDQSRYDDRGRRDSRDYERRRPSYDFCRDRARDITGYRGRTPSRHRGGALEGAIKGGIGASAGSWIGGGDKKQVRKARERGAKLGFIIGAIKAGKERERNREDDRRRRDYEYEVRACMDDY